MELEQEDQGLQQHAYLIINQQVYPLDRIVTNLGRRRENDIVIKEPEVSRQHAQIRYENGRFVLYDNDSTGGTFVNGQQVDRSILYTGDVIRMADVLITFVDGGSDFGEQLKKETGDL
ncbi:MAG: FHA domain-containing protein [Anaerolineales bacterium]|nr:FHA domain-containing protein [Anaerolineales bacterium]